MMKFNVVIKLSSCLEVEAQNAEEAREKVRNFSWRGTFEEMLASPTGIMEDVEVYEEVEENDYND